MFALLGSVLGFGTSFAPKILETINKGQEQKHELAKMRASAELKMQMQDAEFDYQKEMAHHEEHKRLIEHDIAISKETGFFAGLKKGVRPILTYCFFGFFLFYKTVLVMEAMRSGQTISDISDVIWDEQSQAIFAAIISFWFGSRAVEKLK
tara:strand:- start:11460 stop:11912 length:453 start_codon:yes stop_codon:yes gene_type:complete